MSNTTPRKVWKRWPNTVAYLLFTTIMLMTIFQYTQDQRKQDVAFTLRVCHSLEAYRKDSNTRRFFIYDMLQKTLKKGVRQDGTKLTPQEVKLTRMFAQSFSPTPPLSDCSRDIDKNA